MGPSRRARVVYYYGSLTPRITTRTVMVLTIERNLVLIAASLTLDAQLASCTVSHAKYLYISLNELEASFAHNIDKLITNCVF
jgi:hypothetical protein